MADMKYIIDTSDVVSAQRDIRQWAKVNRDSLNSVNQRMGSFGKTSELAFNQFGRAASKAQQKSKRFASVGMQQVGYQVQDFAVQVQSGTNSLVALGQQGSQLLGIFGPAGANAGMILAIGTGLANAFLSAKRASEDMGKSVKELTQDIKNLTAAQDESIRALQLGVTKEELSFRDKIILAEKEQAEAVEQLTIRKEQLARQNEDSAQFYRKEKQALDEATAAVEGAEKAYRDFLEARELKRGLEELQKVPKAAGQLWDTLKDKFSDSVAEIEKLKEELGDSVYEAARLAGVDMESGINDAAVAAGVLATQLGISLERAQEIKGMTPAEAASGGFIGSRRGPGQRPDDPGASRGASTMSIPPLSSLSTGGTRGGGVGAGGVDPVEEYNRAREALTSLIAQYDEGVAEAQKLSQAQETINEAVRNGVITTEQGQTAMQGYIQSLDQANNPIKQLGDTLKNSLGDAFTSIVDGSKSAGEAFRDMARMVIKQAFEMLVVQPILNSMFGGGGGGSFLTALFSANGNAFTKGGKVTPFADGGVVSAPTAFQHSGGLGVMGEAGPEAIMPLKRGKNGKLGVEAEGSQGNVTVQNHFHIAANGDDSVKRIIAQEAPRIANLTQKQILDQRRRGGTFKSTFG